MTLSSFCRACAGAAIGSVVAALATANLPGCASVLGVDKTYTLVDGGAVGVGSLDSGSGSDGATTNAGTIRCGSASPCEASSQECCMNSSDALVCASSSSSDPCPQGTDIRCDDASDCTGEVCCIQLDTGNDVLGTQCKASCPTTRGWTELCAPPGSQGGGCTHGTCAALTVLPNPPFPPSWFYGCQ